MLLVNGQDLVHNAVETGVTGRDRMRTNSGRILLSASTKKAGHQLLDHECWVMGRDILSSAGNLLCEFGFCQVRCPNGGLTQYVGIPVKVNNDSGGKPNGIPERR